MYIDYFYRFARKTQEGKQKVTPVLDSLGKKLKGYPTFFGGISHCLHAERISSPRYK
jgi:hypothetical protein